MGFTKAPVTALKRRLWPPGAAHQAPGEPANLAEATRWPHTAWAPPSDGDGRRAIGSSSGDLRRCRPAHARPRLRRHHDRGGRAAARRHEGGALLLRAEQGGAALPDPLADAEPG